MSMILGEFRGQQRRRKDTSNDESSQPLFLKKTYNMISNCPSDIAGWSEDGTSIVVRDADRLAAEIIPTVYKHNKFSSFVRQLNFYGFRKLRFESRANYWEFKHPLFRRGDMASISQIKKSAHFQDENTTTTTAVKEVKEEVGDVKNQLSDLNKRMSDLDDMIVSLSKILIQNSNLPTQSSISSSSSLLALTNTHTTVSSNTFENSISNMIENQQQISYQSVVIKEEYNGPSDTKKRKTKSSYQKQQFSPSKIYNQPPLTDELIIPFHHQQMQQQQQQQQQMQQQQQSSVYSNQIVPMSIVPLSRSLSLQSNQSSSQFLLNRSFSMNGNSVIGEYMEGGLNSSNSSNNDEDLNFEYLFAMEEKELLKIQKDEITNEMMNNANIYYTNYNSSSNNNSINTIDIPTAHTSSSSESVNTGHSYSTDATDMEVISNYMMSANNTNTSTVRVSLPVTTVAHEHAVEHSMKDNNKEEKEKEITSSSTSTAATADDVLSSNMSKLSNVIDKVDVTDISAIIAVLPRHLQDRFIDQLAASMQLKVHENNQLLSSSSEKQSPHVLSSSVSVNTTDTPSSPSPSGIFDSHDKKQQPCQGRTSFQVIPHHDHNDLTFTYHCPVNNTHTNTNNTSTTNASVVASSSTCVNMATDTHIVVSDSSIAMTGTENAEVDMEAIHSKLTSQLTVAAASVAAACSPDTDTGATIMSMVDENTVASFASMIIKYVYSQDMGNQYKPFQQQQQQQQKVGYVH